MELVKAR